MRTHTQMTAQQLKPYVGTMQQLAGVRTSVLDDGRGRGVRVADFDNGSGLAFQVLLDRGMDIGRATFKGIPLGYLTPVGIVHPSYYEPDGLRWLRSFGGGLLTGCGLSTVGSPEAESGMRVDGPLGLHGRLSNTPAEKPAVAEEWVDGQYRLKVSGLLREASFFAENLECHRTISTVFGSNCITITDRLTNRGVRPAPLMLLYHINTGFPLLGKNAVLQTKARSTTPRNEIAAAGLADWARCQKPTAGYVEQCFYHDIEVESDGLARMTLANPDCGLELEVAFRKAELPCFTQWKMMGQQEYVMGLEPANCHPDGQAAAKEKGTLKILQPDETIEHFLKISISTLASS
ncbi:MAG: aldose 1-epimerase family protein [Kiritimatiellaeota bacterium]|nr:aldose 1-epimerase family protein [Kiritimatiellota bacterium]